MNAGHRWRRANQPFFLAAGFGAVEAWAAGIRSSTGMPSPVRSVPGCSVQDAPATSSESPATRGHRLATRSAMPAVRSTTPEIADTSGTVHGGIEHGNRTD